MKRAMYLAIMLSSVILTGCYDDYVEVDSTEIIQSETAVTKESVPLTEGISSEATMNSSDMVPTMTEAWTAAETLPQEEAEIFTAEPTETDLTEDIAEISTDPTTTTTGITPSAESTAPAETEPITETEMTEPETEPTEETTAESVQSDYDKALAVYEYMLENGHGTCVNYACQTFEKCQEIGLPCYIVWTDAQLYGHVANTVQVDGIWFILDTQGQKFLTYNSGFTEVIDMETHHIGGAEMLSNYRYDEMFGENN